MKNIRLLFLLCLFASLSLQAQDDLFDLFETDEPTIDYAFATFKTSRVVYGQSVESPAAGNLLFLIKHNFGAVNSGFYDFFGLDMATIRLGFEYGITDNITIGYGRNSWEKTYDGFVKVKLLRQSSGARNMPLTLSYFAGMAINTLKWHDTERTNYFSSRLSYAHQLLIARKFGEAFSLQLSPTVIHKNLVPTKADKNTSFAAGIGGRYKLSERVTINAEYFYYPDEQTTRNRNDVISLGFDIETGGHVFQIHISNGQAMFERAFITETAGRWENGDIFLGFNITRNFLIIKPKEFR